MSNISPSLRHLNDADRERAIARCHRALVTARDIRSKAAAWRIMARLIKGRSIQTVERLERERGLGRSS